MRAGIRRFGEYRSRVRRGSERMPVSGQPPATAMFLFMFHFGSV
jgi:hypothetical protein